MVAFVVLNFLTVLSFTWWSWNIFLILVFVWGFFVLFFGFFSLLLFFYRPMVSFSDSTDFNFNFIRSPVFCTTL